MKVPSMLGWNAATGPPFFNGQTHLGTPTLLYLNEIGASGGGGTVAGFHLCILGLS